VIPRWFLLRLKSVEPARPGTMGKQDFYTQIDLDRQKAYAYAKEVMSMNALAADAQEGIGAFLGKRAPCWSGK
jgi:enoyl-CoA hydratase/carnithine racemase